MTVVRLDGRRGLALCADAEGARHTVETALVEPLGAGRVVLVHAGVAIALLTGEGHRPASRVAITPLPGEGGPPAGATSLQRSAEEVAPTTLAAAGGAA
jgi:hydrogenase maturation factor